jgi:anti-sigma-K factor RskA
MKNNQINKLESLAREGFLSENKIAPSAEWQNEVIADIKRRKHAGKFNKKIQPQSLLQPRLVWRFAAASLAVAIVICFSLYLALPDTASNDYQTDEVSFDNFDNYIEIIVQS